MWVAVIKEALKQTKAAGDSCNPDVPLEVVGTFAFSRSVLDSHSKLCVEGTHHIVFIFNQGWDSIKG